MRWTMLLTSSGVSFGLAVLAAVPMVFLVNKTPDRIPADVIAEEAAAAERVGETKAASD